MILRQATPGDAAAIAALVNDLIAHTAITFTTLPKTAQEIANDIASRGPAYLVAERNGTFLGHATFGAFRGGPGYARTVEHSIALTPEARGQGVGAALMAALQTCAVDDGIHAMIAGVSGENKTGIAFHARLGFDEVGRLPEVGFKFGRWMDLVLMQKIL